MREMYSTRCGPIRFNEPARFIADVQATANDSPASSRIVPRKPARSAASDPRFWDVAVVLRVKDTGTTVEMLLQGSVPRSKPGPKVRGTLLHGNGGARHSLNEIGTRLKVSRDT